MKPNIITKPAFKVAGLRYFGNNKNKEIKYLWGSFVKRMKELDSIENNISYGVCIMPEEKNEDGSFEYIACVEVKDINNLPEGMTGRELKEQKYAVFTHKGSIDNIADTYGEIFNKLLKENNLEPADAPDLELYDERFKPYSEESEVDIYIPIK